MTTMLVDILVNGKKLDFSPSKKGLRKKSVDSRSPKQLRKPRTGSCSSELNELPEKTHLSPKSASHSFTNLIRSPSSLLIRSPSLKRSPPHVDLLKNILEHNCRQVRSALKRHVFLTVQQNTRVALECAQTGCVKCAKTLQRHGVLLVDARDDRGWSTLHVAVLADRTELLQYLLTSGASADVVDTHGITPLHVAVYTNNLIMAHKLCMARADCFKETEYGTTPFQLAIDLKTTTILDYFIYSWTQFNHSQKDVYH